MPPQTLDAAAPRSLTRLTCVYGLTGAAPVASLKTLELPSEVEGWTLGRFERHYVRAADASEDVPRIGAPTDWPAGGELATGTVPFGTALWAEARVVVVPYSATLLLLELDLDVGFLDLVAALQETCFRRETLRIGGANVLDAARGSLPGEALKRASFGADVHQILFLAESVAAPIRRDAQEPQSFDTRSLLQLVYREAESFRPAGASICYPAELNRPAASIAAHGRGVSVIAGAAAHVERAVSLTALELVACSERLRAIRRQAVRALDLVRDKDDVRLSALAAERAALAQLARDLRELELHLSFGVEQYLDNIRIPEIVLTSYRRSLGESLELPDGVRRTSSMIDRLRRAIDARQVEVETAAAAVDEARRSANSWAVGYVSLIAVPIGIVLAFLGASVSEVSASRSIWDLHAYWRYYGLALLVVLAGGVVYAVVRAAKAAALRARFRR
jgi:hypothetical protein